MTKVFEKKIGLVLPGGGARAAYQVGVLKAISELIPDSNPFSIISGTSAGAINASLLASRSQSLKEAVEVLSGVWCNFKTNKVYRTETTVMLKSIFQWLLTVSSGGVLAKNPKSLLDNSPLRQLLEDTINLEGIKNNIDKGNLDAFAITAASYSSKKSVTFFQSEEDDIDWERFLRVGVKTDILIDHLMASIALPLIFPAVKINNEYFGDGAMRQATPLSPAIRLGAEKLLIINTDSKSPNNQLTDNQIYPSIGEVGGYMLDALFTGGLLSDLERLDRINQIIENSGNNSVQTSNKKMKHLDYCVISPSKDIKKIAKEHYKDVPYSVKLLMKGLGLKNREESELLSFLLFESSFTSSLIQLGFEDGMTNQSEIKAILA
ncbi:MAG: patatin-like phospholipase family protein [Gammaproteobacteria bacterium]|nr:patatin-like phospholipase family protein [Gammaproteobacteria bacterium]